MLKFSVRQINFIKFTCIALTTAVYFLRLDSTVGLMVDDSWYALLARSIAEGHGYHLINSTVPQTTPLYPPGYPVILSFVWLFNSNFSDNVIAMKLVSLTALALTWKLLLHLNRQYLQVSEAMNWLTSTAVLLTPLLVYYATSTLMSECVFLLLQTLVIVLCFKAETANSKKWIVAIGLIAGFASIIRIVGIVLIVAGTLTFLLRKKFGAATIICCLGFIPVGIWTAYSHRASTLAPEERSNYVANNYLFHFLRSDENNLTSPNVTASEFGHRIGKNFYDLIASSFGNLFAPYLSPKRFPAGTAVSFVIALISFIGLVQSIRNNLNFIEIYVLISLLLILGWGYNPTRFLVVLMPILLQYFVGGIGWFAEKTNSQKANLQLLIISIILLGFAGVHLAAIAIKYNLPFSARLKNQFVMFEQRNNCDEIIQWTRKNIPANEVIATDVPALIFLHTNHKTVHLINPEKDKDLWRQLGIRHVVLSGITTVHPLEGFPILFSTNDQKAVIYKIQ